MIEYKITPRNNEYGGILADLFASVSNFEYDSNIVYDRYHGQYIPPSPTITLKFNTDAVFESYFMCLLDDEGFVKHDIGFDLTITLFDKKGCGMRRINCLNAKISNMSLDSNENVMDFYCNHITTEYLNL